MTKQEFIDKFITLDTVYELAVKHNDLRAISEIGDEIMSLHQKMSEELTADDAFEVCVLLDAI